MAPVKPPKRSQSAQSVYSRRMMIKRESVKPMREWIARTPSTVPNDVQEARRGVYWEHNVPDRCRKHAPDSQSARNAFVIQLTTQLARQNKIVVAARWMADGLTLDWVNDAAASKRFLESRPRSQDGNVLSMKRSTASVPPSVSSKASRREPDEHNAQKNHGQSDSFASHVATDNLQVHSNHPPMAPFLRRAQRYKKSHKAPSPKGRSPKGRSRRAPPKSPAYSGYNSRGTTKQISTVIFLTPIDPRIHVHTPAADVPMLHEVPQGRASNQQPCCISTMQKSRAHNVSSRENDASNRTEDSSGDGQPRSIHNPQPSRRNFNYNDDSSFVLRPLRTLGNSSTVVGSRGVVLPSPFPSAARALVRDSMGSSSSTRKDRPMDKEAQPPRHPASLVPTPNNVFTGVHGASGAKGQPPYSEGNESDVSMEYECRPTAMDLEMDHNTMRVQNSSNSEDEEPPVDPSPRVSVQREESPPVTRPSKTLRVPLYNIAENMPIPLPHAPFARGRRLLIPSDSTKSIAWVSMRGDMQFIDGTSRTRIARYSLPATDDEHFRLADACRLGDGYCIQAHMNGPYRFSVVKTPSGTQAPERRHLSEMQSKISPCINSIISISNRDFVTGNDRHIIRLWRLHSEEEEPQVTRTEAIKGRHKSAVRALAMGGDTLWSASGYNLLGTDILSRKTALEPIVRASSSISQIHCHQHFLILETRDHDTPFRVYDTRTINAAQDEPVLKFGLSPLKVPSSFRKGGWINTTFVHGFTHPVTKVEQVLLWDLRETSRPTQRLELGHVATHCVFWKGGKEVVVTGDRCVSFLSL